MKKDRSIKKSSTLRNAGNVLFALVFVASISLYSGDTYAAGSWNDVFKNIGDTIDAFKKLVVVAAYGVGVTLFFLGLWLVYKDGKEENRGHMKNGIISLVIGTLLLAFPTTIGWTATSIGATKTETDKAGF